MGDSIREKQCVHSLAGLFRAGNRDIYQPRDRVLFDGITLEQAEFDALMATMEVWGVISNVSHSPAPYSYIRITGNAVNKAREFDAIEQAEKEPKDIVELAYQTARKNRICAYAIIAATVVVFLLAAFHQALQVYQDVTKDNKPPPIIINITPDMLKQQK